MTCWRNLSSLRRARRAGRSLLFAGLSFFAAGSHVLAADQPEHPLLAAVIASVDAGEHQLADARIEAALAHPDTAGHLRQALLFQRERARRIASEFTLDENQVLSRLRALIPDMREDEFRQWDRQGQLEHLFINGEKRYFRKAVSNLFYVNPAAVARRAKTAARFLDDAPLYAPHAHHRQVIDAALASGKPGVEKKTLRIRQHITVKKDAVPDGEMLRIWLPFPRDIPGHQDNIRLLSSHPVPARIAGNENLQRTAYFEVPARAGADTTVSIEYETDIRAQYHAIDPDKVVPAGAGAALAEHLAERPPHIVFTDKLKAFSRAVVGEEKNPYRIAQKLFAAVDQIPWAGAREYSTLSNISDYAFTAGHADCGQQTLLLITLLRMNGIPARWQSGWEFSDGKFDTMHDWAYAYFAPHGWVPVDVTHGVLAADDPRIKWFYLGGLDSYRLIFNDDYSREFSPAKQHFRSETVDLQRGEVEWRSGNLYFDQWDYGLDWAVDAPLPPAR